MDQPLRKYQILEKIPETVVATSNVYNYVGAMNSDRIVNAAMQFLLANVVSEDIKAYRGIIDEFLRTVTEPAVWFTIRLSKRTDEFKIPRWHRDGKMFHTGANPGEPSRCYKIAVTLLGAPTLILESTPSATEIMRERRYDDRREFLARALANSPRVEIVTGQIFAFTCGEPDAPVHSEPDITSDRIFMSAVPGTPGQLKDLAEIRSLEYYD